MANVTPFRALRYDPSRVTLSAVVTQPYDKITSEMQERYYQSSPYNLVRIILGKREASDSEGNNPYTRAAASFSQWRGQGVFKRDSEPSLYAYAQKFVAPGTSAEFERRGFIALGRIEDYSAGVVFRHEQTLAKPKADRLQLLRATRAHFGQIFMLYSDPAQRIDKVLTFDAQPTVQVKDEYGVTHRMWKVSDSGLIDRVRGEMQDKKLIIADGHHRYETALTYRNEQRAQADEAVNQEPPYEHVMMTFVNMDSPGLLILPTHRVVHGLPSFSADAFRDAAQQHYRVKEVDPALNATQFEGLLRDAGRAGTALMAVSSGHAFLIDQPKSAAVSLFAGLSPRQQSLDVVQLHKCLLEGVLGLSEESIRNQQNISYIREAAEAVARVRSSEANLAFLMNPARMEQVRDIAFAGEVLPQKSTDFYPKLLSGLTVYPLDTPAET